MENGEERKIEENNRENEINQNNESREEVEKEETKKIKKKRRKISDLELAAAVQKEWNTPRPKRLATMQIKKGFFTENESGKIIRYQPSELVCIKRGDYGGNYRQQMENEEKNRLERKKEKKYENILDLCLDLLQPDFMYKEIPEQNNVEENNGVNDINNENTTNTVDKIDNNQIINNDNNNDSIHNNTDAITIIEDEKEENKNENNNREENNENIQNTKKRKLDELNEEEKDNNNNNNNNNNSNQLLKVDPSSPYAIQEGVKLSQIKNYQSTIEKKPQKSRPKKQRIDDDGWFIDPDLRWSEGTWINCDVRYFNFSCLAGNFDIIHMDPPWRIKGSDLQSSSKSMFTNAPFSLNYNTLSNEEIMDIDVGCLSNGGFIFLWVINSQMQAALDCLTHWGYQYIDRIVWVKKTKYNNIAISQGYYFLHSTEICLIGYKPHKEKSQVQYIHKVTNDVVFGEVRQKSRKPDQIYTIMEAMMPGARKIEIFARNHNIRPGWLALGNQLGEYYDWDHDAITCDTCNQEIELGSHRYKSRYHANSDICKNCFEKSGRAVDDFIILENKTGEMVFHEYIECDRCKSQPIPGIRFTCTECDSFDVCEACYDKPLPLGDLDHKREHKFKAIELPELAGGLPIHRLKCGGCNTFPIIGYCFTCAVCTYLYFCQKCFFMKKEPKSHKISHRIEVYIEPDSGESFEIKCDCCGVRPIVGKRYKCDSCFNFDLCAKCYSSRAEIPARFVSHKPNHTFSVIENGYVPGSEEDIEN